MDFTVEPEIAETMELSREHGHLDKPVAVMFG